MQKINKLIYIAHDDNSITLSCANTPVSITVTEAKKIIKVLQNITKSTTQKYKNKKVIFDGVEFDSVMECDFYKFLIAKFDKKDIDLQPKFELIPKLAGARATNYIGDFMVGHIVYDVKGYETKDFKIKKKLFNVNYPDLSLQLITRCPRWLQMKYGQWIEIGDLKKERKLKKGAKSG